MVYNCTSWKCVMECGPPFVGCFGCEVLADAKQTYSDLTCCGIAAQPLLCRAQYYIIMCVNSYAWNGRMAMPDRCRYDIEKFMHIIQPGRLTSLSNNTVNSTRGVIHQYMHVYYVHACGGHTLYI